MIAIISGQNILEIATNEAASLEGMAAYAEMGYRSLLRVNVPDAVYAAYSAGAALTTDIEVEDGIATTVVVVAE